MANVGTAHFARDTSGTIAVQQNQLIAWTTRAVAVVLTIGVLVVSVSAAEAQTRYTTTQYQAQQGTVAPDNAEQPRQFVNPLDRLKGKSPYELFQQRRDARVKDNFAQLDLNQDTVLTEREILKYRQRLFRQRDANKDKRLLEGVFIAFRDAQTGKFLNYERYLKTQRGYYNIDRNHDGVLMRGEFMRVGQIYFRRLDQNRDGTVTFEEYNTDPTARGFLQN